MPQTIEPGHHQDFAGAYTSLVVIGGKPPEEPVLRGRYRIVVIADRVSK